MAARGAFVNFNVLLPICTNLSSILELQLKRAPSSRASLDSPARSGGSSAIYLHGMPCRLDCGLLAHPKRVLVAGLNDNELGEVGRFQP